MFVIACLLPGLLLLQIYPASAADTWRQYYNGVSAPAVGRVGPTGNLVGGQAHLSYGAQASTGVYTYSPTGVLVFGTTQASVGPTTLTHALVINGYSGCTWLKGAGTGESREFLCKDLRRS